MICRAIWDDVLSDESIKWMAHQTILDQDKLRADSDLEIVRLSLADVRNQKNNLLNAIKAGIFTNTTRDELLRLEQEEASLAERVKVNEKMMSDLPTEDDIISYLEFFREGHVDQEFTRTGLLDAFVSKVVIRPTRALIYFRVMAEDRQKEVDLSDLPDPSNDPGKSSFRLHSSPLVRTKRTLYHVDGYFVLEIAA
jgi:hypothetical protein